MNELNLKFDEKDEEYRIDFQQIISFLEDYAGKKYKSPDNSKIQDDKEREEMERFKKEGSKARDKFKDFCTHVVSLFPDDLKNDLEVGKCSNWINSGQMGKEYFWVELKKKSWKKYPHSISISLNNEFFDKEGVLYVSIETRDASSKDEDYFRHNVIADKEIPEGVDAYYAYYKEDKSSNKEDEGSNKEYKCFIAEGGQQEVLKLLNDGELKKVLIIKEISKPYESDRAMEIIKETKEAIEFLLPYYDYIFEKDNLVKSVKHLDVEKKEKMSEISLNTILYGPPGTGKTYNTAIYAVAVCENSPIDTIKEWNYNEKIMPRYRELLENRRIAFTTFHQSYGYEEFIEGIKPKLDSDSFEIGYTIKEGVFKEFCERAIKNKDQKYVFIIDEINRGNISKIFGELITLVEDTKREGMKEQASAVLPYSSESFSVPSNVYILGTMNTADRSIALMDTALRRRFEFVEMMPNADVLRKIKAYKVEDLDVAFMLERINERIAFLYDREHTIGHAFFTKLAENPTIDTLKTIFEKSVIPLLQEYFYEDYQKIQWVLGDNGKTDPSTKFILDEEVEVKELFKGNVDDVIDLPEKKYTINRESFGNIESYKQII